ncbi:hypothetical protein Naga_101290g2, partial [Nannochloropsis gaditana]
LTCTPGIIPSTNPPSSSRALPCFPSILLTTPSLPSPPMARRRLGLDIRRLASGGGMGRLLSLFGAKSTAAVRRRDREGERGGRRAGGGGGEGRGVCTGALAKGGRAGLGGEKGRPAWSE